MYIWSHHPTILIFKKWSVDSNLGCPYSHGCDHPLEHGLPGASLLKETDLYTSEDISCQQLVWHREGPWAISITNIPNGKVETIEAKGHYIYLFILKQT